MERAEGLLESLSSRKLAKLGRRAAWQEPQGLAGGGGAQGETQSPGSLCQHQR